MEEANDKDTLVDSCVGRRFALCRSRNSLCGRFRTAKNFSTGHIKIERVEHPTPASLNERKRYTLRIWSDDKYKWIGQDVKDLKEFRSLKQGTDYFVLLFTVWFRNICERPVWVRPSVFIFEDGSVLPAGRPLVNTSELTGPGVFEPYWLHVHPEMGEYSLCSFWQHVDRATGEFLKPPRMHHPYCGVIVTADGYSSKAHYRVGLSGYECDPAALSKQGAELSTFGENFARNDEICGLSNVAAPADPPEKPLN